MAGKAVQATKFFEGVCVTTVILAPGASGRWAPRRPSWRHLPLSRGRGDEFQKRPKCYYTHHFRAREVRGPFRAMHRLRSWSGSRRSRGRESIAKSTFIRKTHMIWKTFIRIFAERSPTPYFYSEISPSRGPSFHNFDSKLAKLHFWPKRGQWDPIGSPFDPIWIKVEPNWVKLGPNLAQYKFTNSRSTAQADVMLIKVPLQGIMAEVQKSCMCFQIFFLYTNKTFLLRLHCTSRLTIPIHM